MKQIRLNQIIFYFFWVIVWAGLWLAFRPTVSLGDLLDRSADAPAQVDPQPAMVAPTAPAASENIAPPESSQLADTTLAEPETLPAEPASGDERAMDDSAMGMSNNSMMAGDNKMDNAPAPPPAPALDLETAREMAAENAGISFDTSTTEGYAMANVASADDFVRFLATIPGWTADTYADSETVWHVNFYDSNGEWIAEGHTDINSGEVFDTYVPRLLSDEERAAGEQRVQALVFNDAEVLARLGDPDRWDYEIEWDPYAQNWTVWFWRDNEALGVPVQVYDGELYIGELFDPNALDEAEAYLAARDRAIELAFSSPSIWTALEGIDNWTVYAEPVDGAQWTVAVTTPDGTHFSALVDLESGEIVEENAGN